MPVPRLHKETSIFGAESIAGGFAAASQANAEEQQIYIQAIAGTTTATPPSAWVEAVDESVASDAAGLTPHWTAKHPTYRQNYPVTLVATQRKRLDGTVECSAVTVDDTVTVIDGGNIITGSVTAGKVNFADASGNQLKLFEPNSPTNYAALSGSGMEVFKNGTSVASFGSSARIGSTSSNHIGVASGGITFSEGSKEIATITARSVTRYPANWESYSYVDTSQWQDGANGNAVTFATINNAGSDFHDFIAGYVFSGGEFLHILVNMEDVQDVLGGSFSYSSSYAEYNLQYYKSGINHYVMVRSSLSTLTDYDLGSFAPTAVDGVTSSQMDVNADLYANNIDCNGALESESVTTRAISSPDGYASIRFGNMEHGLPAGHLGTQETPLLISVSVDGNSVLDINADGTILVDGDDIHSTSLFTNGTLGIARGGTGKASFTAYQPIVGGTTTTGALQSMSSTSTGAMYRTSTTALPVWGTLPAAQGGTGQTSLQATRNAMGLGNTTGVLPQANGGTGRAQSTANRTFYCGRVLYNNATGTTGTVTLSETAANFTFMYIGFKGNDSCFDGMYVYSPNSKVVTLNLIENTVNTQTNKKWRTCTISATSITTKNYGEEDASSHSATNHIYITSVIGFV